MSSQTHHLIRRGGVWYYRRRVPLALVASVGKKEIQVSLDTTDLADAKKRRAVEELKWNARFDTVADEDCSSHTEIVPAQSRTGLMELILKHVETTDARSRGQFLSDPPETMSQKAEMRIDAETGLGILKNLDDPRGAELVHAASLQIIKGAPNQVGQQPQDFFTEAVRRMRS